MVLEVDWFSVERLGHLYKKKFQLESIFTFLVFKKKQRIKLSKSNLFYDAWTVLFFKCATRQDCREIVVACICVYQDFSKRKKKCSYLLPLVHEKAEKQHYLNVKNNSFDINVILRFFYKISLKMSIFISTRITCKYIDFCKYYLWSSPCSVTKSNFMCIRFVWWRNFKRKPIAAMPNLKKGS